MTAPCPRCNGRGRITLYQSLAGAVQRGWTCRYVTTQPCDHCHCVCGQPPITPGGLCTPCDDAAWLAEDRAYQRREDR
jgi:hypothetical protein